MTFEIRVEVHSTLYNFTCSTWTKNPLPSTFLYSIRIIKILIVRIFDFLLSWTWHRVVREYGGDLCFLQNEKDFFSLFKQFNSRVWFCNFVNLIMFIKDWRQKKSLLPFFARPFKSVVLIRHSTVHGDVVCTFSYNWIERLRKGEPTK